MDEIICPFRTRYNAARTTQIPVVMTMFHKGLFLVGPMPASGNPGTAAEVDVVVLGGVVTTGVGIAAQVGPEIVLAFNVTVAAACAKTRPFKVAPLFKAVESATLAVTIFPLNAVVVPRVAALPILHHTLQASPPVTDEPDDVMSVDTVLKM